MDHLTTAGDRAIPVRVVRVTEHRRWGGMIMLAGIAITLLHPKIGSTEADAWLLQAAIGLWCAGSIFTFRPKPRTAMLRISGGEVRLGETLLRDIVDASVARGDHGFSIALSMGGEPVFLEVESEADARALLAALDIPWPGVASIEIVARNENLRLLQRVIAGAGLLLLTIGALLTLGNEQLGNDASRVLGPLAVFCTLAASALYGLDPKLRRRFILGENSRIAKGTADSKSIVDDHVRAHLRHRISTKDDAPPSSAAGHARSLDKGSETTRAWLARVDAIGAGEGGYRGAAPTPEELWQIVEDPAAPERSKLAAIRLLGRKYGAKEELQSRVDDAMGARVRVVVEEEDAAEELDALGPIFRAKERA